MSRTIILRNGPAELTVTEDDGSEDCNTLQDFLDRFAEQQNIPASASLAVDGAPATGSTTLPDGEVEIAVNKPTGSKGL